jgi:hypothetical protein
VSVVLDEAKAAGRLIKAVEAHDEAFDLAAFGEQLVDLLFGCVEGAVVVAVGSGGEEEGRKQGRATHRFPTYSVAASFSGSSRGTSVLVR